MKKLYKVYVMSLTLMMLMAFMVPSAFAVDDMWTVANTIIVDVYSKIAGISTVLAGLMSAVAVVGAKISNNQHKVDQAWDWLKRIWIAWAIINGIGAFIAYVAPFFSGLAMLTRGKRHRRISLRLCLGCYCSPRMLCHSRLLYSTRRTWTLPRPLSTT